MTDVFAAMAARIGGTEGESHMGAVTFAYYVADPLAVHMTTWVGGQPVPWAFGRQLLASGLKQATGDGDVVIYPSGRAIGIVLAGSEDYALIELSRAKVSGFLRRSYTAVPLGREAVDVDALIANLLADVP